MRCITSGMPSFSNPPTLSFVSGVVIRLFNRGTYSPLKLALSALNKPPATQCEWSSIRSRLFLECVLFLPSQSGNRLKFRSLG
jgi:hypothetical protein